MRAERVATLSPLKPDLGMAVRPVTPIVPATTAISATLRAHQRRPQAPRPPPFTAHYARVARAPLAAAPLAPAKQGALLEAGNTAEPSRDFGLALLDAFRGQKEKAVREAKRALDQTLGPAGSIEKNQISSRHDLCANRRAG